jgi:Bifunctional DNA primase/polymerase, N-terminal
MHDHNRFQSARNNSFDAHSPQAVRRQLLQNGYVPIPTRGKIPALNGWQHVVATEHEISEWESSCRNARDTGILTRTTPAVDIDILDPEAADLIAGLVDEVIPDGCPRLIRVGREPKRAILFRTDTPFQKFRPESGSRKTDSSTGSRSWPMANTLSCTAHILRRGSRTLGAAKLLTKRRGRRCRCWRRPIKPNPSQP